MSPVEAERSSPEAQSPESRTVSPAPQPGSAARPSLPRIVEALTKMSAAFAVFGYLSLRSHLNTLGISTRGSFGVERYLAELPEIIGIILFSLLGFGIPFAILCVVAAACSWLWRRVPAGSPVSIRLTRITEFIFACIESNEGPILASAGILLLGWLTMQTLMSGGSTSIGLAVGDLTNSHRPQEWALFFAILYGCGVAYLLCHGCRRHVERSQGRHASLWYLPMVLIACVAVQIPILYGHILHSSEYAKAQIFLGTEAESKHADPVCGLILLHDGSDLLLWQVQGTVGRIRAIPVSEIKQTITGESADVWDLIEHAGRHQEVSLCPAGAGH